MSLEEKLSPDEDENNRLKDKNDLIIYKLRGLYSTLFGDDVSKNSINKGLIPYLIQKMDKMIQAVPMRFKDRIEELRENVQIWYEDARDESGCIKCSVQLIAHDLESGYRTEKDTFHMENPAMREEYQAQPSSREEVETEKNSLLRAYSFVRNKVDELIKNVYENLKEIDDDLGGIYLQIIHPIVNELREKSVELYGRMEEVEYDLTSRLFTRPREA